MGHEEVGRESEWELLGWRVGRCYDDLYDSDLARCGGCISGRALVYWIYIYIKTVLNMLVRWGCDACGSLPRVGYVGVSVP